MERYLKQGIKMVVVGRIQNDNYTNKDGQKVYSVQVMVDELEFAESKNASSAGDSGAFSQPAAARPTPSAAVNDGFMNVPEGIDEELPFN